MVDEEIAKMLRKERVKARKLEEEARERKEEEELDLEEVKRQMKEGELKLYDREFSFEMRDLLKNRIRVILPFDGIVEKKNLDEVYESMSDELAFSSHFVLEEGAADFMELDVYKKNMEKNLDGTGLSFKWNEEGAMMVNGVKLQYLDFVTTTGLGAVHNSMWFIYCKYGRLLCNINYDHKEKRYWKPIVSAMMQTIEVR